MKQEYLNITPIEVFLKDKDEAVTLLLLTFILSIDDALESLCVQYSLFEEHVTEANLQSIDVYQTIINEDAFSGSFSNEMARNTICMTGNDGEYKTASDYLHVREDKRGGGLGTALMKITANHLLKDLRQVNKNTKQVKMVTEDGSDDGWTSRRLEDAGLEDVTRVGDRNRKFRYLFS